MDLTAGTDPTGTARPAPGRAEQRMRRASLGSLLALLIEYGLGVGTNLYVTVPSSDQGVGTMKAFGKSFSGGPAALAAHAGVGLLLIVNVIVVLVLALRSRRAGVIASSAVALLCVVGAAFSGASFVNNGENGASMGMAVLTGVALACYAVNLYLLGAERRV